MTFDTVLFYILALVLVVAAFRVITATSPVTGVLHLILTFFTASMMWMLIQAEFLALVLVLVYVGAVMVLFLFVVMMLDINVESLRSGFTKYAWLGWITAAVVVVEIIGVVTARSMGIDVTKGAAPTPEGYSNTTDLGVTLYTKYAYPFELAAVLLLVAIVAAIALTMRKRPNLKVQDVVAQTAVRARDRVRVIKMDPVKDEPAAAEASSSNTEKSA